MKKNLQRRLHTFTIHELGRVQGGLAIPSLHALAGIGGNAFPAAPGFPNAPSLAPNGSGNIGSPFMEGPFGPAQGGSGGALDAHSFDEAGNGGSTMGWHDTPDMSHAGSFGGAGANADQYSMGPDGGWYTHDGEPFAPSAAASAGAHEGYEPSYSMGPDGGSYTQSGTPLEQPSAVAPETNQAADVPTTGGWDESGFESPAPETNGDFYG